jgi:hypothetical protein
MKLDPRTGRPYVLPRHDKLVPPDALEGAPTNVHDANEKARTAIDAALSLREERNAARRRVEEAGRADRQARKEAIATGKPEPKLKIEEARTEAEAAQERYELAVEVANERVDALWDLVEVEADAEWANHVKARIEDELAREAEERAKLRERHHRIASLQSTLRTLHTIDRASGLEVWFPTGGRLASEQPLAELAEIAGTAIDAATEGESGAEAKAKRAQEKAERDARRKAKAEERAERERRFAARNTLAGVNEIG